MIRRCSCGHVAPWSAYHVISDGRDDRSVFAGLVLANCPVCHSTLAEPIARFDTRHPPSSEGEHHGD